MYAVVRQYPYRAGALEATTRALEAVQALHERQPGYAGSLVIDDGRHFVAVNLWDTRDAAATGRAAIGQQVQRLLEPTMAGPSQLIGAGDVLAGDLRER